MQEKIIAAIPQECADTILEVALLQDDRAVSRVEIRSLAWSAGVGWYRQHTLKLDPPAARSLLRALGYVRGHLSHTWSKEQTRKVIPLPSATRAQVALGQQAQSH